MEFWQKSESTDTASCLLVHFFPLQLQTVAAKRTKASKFFSSSGAQFTMFEVERTWLDIRRRGGASKSGTRMPLLPSSGDLFPYFVADLKKIGAFGKSSGFGSLLFTSHQTAR